MKKHTTTSLGANQPKGDSTRWVAEGVETEEVLSALRTLGCDFLQGDCISRPVPANDLARWLANLNATPGAAAS